MTMATVAQSVYHLGQKLLLRDSMIQSYEITYWAGFAVSLSMMVAMTVLEKRDGKVQNIFWIPPGAMLPAIGRGVFGFFSNLGTTYSIQYLPLAKATVIYNTNTIFLGVFGYFLNERITMYDVGGIITTFLGVVMFTMDPFSFSPKLLPSQIDVWHDLLGTLIGFVGAIMSALAYISIKRFSGRGHTLFMPMSWGIGNALGSPLLMFLVAQK